MRFEKKLNTLSQEEIWKEYCGFLDMTIDEYMTVQSRLLMEQIDLMSRCPLGERFFGNNPPKSVEEFRKNVPLTSFQDYADILLPKKEEMLPAKPAIWLKTTWEGGTAPSKVAPYSDSMLEVYKNNIFATVLLATARSRGKFNVRQRASVLYGLAPLPYATGLLPELLSPEMTLRFMPSLKEARKLSFTEQSEVGFRSALLNGIDMFFGMSSIIYGISKRFGDIISANGSKQQGTSPLPFRISPTILTRLLLARYRSKRDKTPIYPKDLFTLNGLVCVGTDSGLFKDELEMYWGCRPLEIAGGTETACMATETWKKDGLVFFPDTSFYEFIPEAEMLRNLEDPSYIPRTYLMNELAANENYEVVVTVLKGGAFMRYRVGDVYRCIRTKNANTDIDLPQFEYVDRIPTVIDIMGFTRITEKEILYVFDMTHIPVSDWFAIKEYDENNHSFLHIYLELDQESSAKYPVSAQFIRDQLSTSFKFYDNDFNDLKRLLGVNPLKVTLLPCGAIHRYAEKNKRPIRKINPLRREILDLLRNEKDVQTSA